MSQNEYLQIPEAARIDSKSFELLRVWVANNGQHISLRVGVWKDPAAWGIMLTDLMHHIANAYYEDQGLNREKCLQRIKAGIDAELSSSTNRSVD